MNRRTIMISSTRARTRAQDLETRIKTPEGSLSSVAKIRAVNAEERRAISDNARLLRDQIDHEEGEYDAANRSVSELTQLMSSNLSIGNNPGAMSDTDLEPASASRIPEKPEFSSFASDGKASRRLACSVRAYT
jgi:hypothetical protein